jgi:hypothetical protein
VYQAKSDMDVKPNNAALIQTYANFLRPLSAKERRQVWDTINQSEANLPNETFDLLAQFGRFSGPETAEELINSIQESSISDRKIESFE